MRRILLLLLSATAALVAAVAVFVGASLPPRALHPSPVPTTDTVVWGAYHIHSSRSDGSGTVEDIAAAAARAGLSFVVLTDHGDATRPPDPPRVLHGVLCIDAVEINTNAGHVVALNLQQASPYPLAGEARDVIEDIHRMGGQAVLAHPDSPREGLRWRGSATGADGIEWLNVDAEWRARRAAEVAATTLRALVRGPEAVASLFQPPRRALARWEEMQRSRPAFAIAATDAHARLGGEQGSRGIGSLRFPSYESMFRTVVQAVPLGAPLTNDAATDARELLLALASGRSYSVIRAFADVLPAVDFTATSAVGRVGLGRHLPAGIAARFHATSIPGARLDLLQDGRVVASGTGQLEFDANGRPGVYRVEVYVAGRTVPWVVTNAIYADGPGSSTRSATPRPAPGSTPAPQVVASAAFVIERDGSSTGTISPDATGLTLAYALGGGVPAGQFVALAAPSGAAPIDRIEFTTSADRPMRISLQVRVAGGKDGLRWRRSIYVDTTPRRHSIALAELEPVERSTSLRPIVARVQSVLFVIDTINTRPGQSGSLVLGDVQLIPGRAEAAGAGR